MKARNIMQKPVIVTTPDASAFDTARQLLSHRITGMPVVERDGTVRGIITEADILRIQVRGTRLQALQVKDLMSPETVAVDAEATLDEVKKLLMEYHILRVPVIENGELVGIISRSDLIKAMIEEPD